jgi:hypothetical protein
MQHKPDPAQLRTSYLSSEIKKRIPRSRETIPNTGIILYTAVFAYIYYHRFLGP